MSRDLDSFISTFRRHRLRLALLFPLLVVGFGYFLAPKILQYRGQSTFFLATDVQASESLKFKSTEARSESKKTNRGYERSLGFIYSERMMNHLISAFDLYQHYGIDTTKPYYRERTIGILTSRTELYKINAELNQVSVYDRNNEIAAAMANAIVRYIDTMNKDYIRQAMKRDLELYRNYIAQASKESDIRLQKLDSALAVLLRTTNGARTGRVTDFEATTAAEEIRVSASAIRSLHESYTAALSVYTSAMGNYKGLMNGSVIQVRRATPDFSSRKWVLLFYSCGASFAAILSLLTLLYLFDNQRDFFVRMFGK
jgi:hypothetical protein